MTGFDFGAGEFCLRMELLPPPRATKRGRAHADAAGGLGRGLGGQICRVNGLMRRSFHARRDRWLAGTVYETISVRPQFVSQIDGGPQLAASWE